MLSIGLKPQHELHSNTLADNFILGLRGAILYALYNFDCLSVRGGVSPERHYFRGETILSLKNLQSHTYTHCVTQKPWCVKMATKQGCKHDATCPQIAMPYLPHCGIHESDHAAAPAKSRHLLFPTALIGLLAGADFHKGRKSTSSPPRTGHDPAGLHVGSLSREVVNPNAIVVSVKHSYVVEHLFSLLL